MSTTAIKERPILFNGEMVRAILRDEKTQTRRIFKPERIAIKPHPKGGFYYETFATREGAICQTGGGPFIAEDWLHYCPYGVPGDRLWVRETWNVRGLCFGMKPSMTKAAAPGAWVYAADDDYKWQHGWLPSIHMPRWASRITLEITDVRVQRLQEISSQDAIAEGISPPECVNADECTSESWPGLGAMRDDLANAAGGRPWRECHCVVEQFANLWDSINGKTASWKSNPWVWAISFKRVKP